MTIKNYVEKVSKRLQSGISREHSYRGDLETLIRELVQGIEITNEPANVTDCGNPDYVITKGKIPIGYMEAKDIGKDLNSKSYKEQFGRYKKALDNLIITDYVWFQFFQNGELVHEIKIGEIENNSVKPILQNFAKFENLIKDFCSHVGQTIKSSKKLAEMMAGKARLLQDILERAITSDKKTQENTSLKDQYDTFKKILIHDLKPKDFADIYAQTLAYGMFAARLHDTILDGFSRQEAAALIPKSNPFLRKLFGYIAGPDIDERIVTVVDNLAEVFRATNVEQLLKNFGKSTQTNDPIIHFYETFLAEYDPKLRKARGVWYTPKPVVNFIIRAVDAILITEFDLPQGLADTSKTTINVKTDIPNKNFKSGYKEVEKEVHKVQILDPATGTGTFLAEVIKHINKKFKGQEGIWSAYVENHLLPRLNGFELLMASYAMAHLQLDLLLKETGFKATKNQRTRVYLTNSLEEAHPDTGTLFATWLSSEANDANHIKRDTPVMCVIGNPPYSGISSNKGKWISDLIEDYKYVDGVHFKERKHWLNDDYVKFLRYGQHFIEKNGNGVLAFINPHGFLDNPTFRGMRWHLLKTYDKIYTIDLHGNSKKKEVCPDNSKDENVFDIMQGVAITFFVKNGKKKVNDLSKVFHYDLYGKRKLKYDFLLKNEIKSIDFNELKPQKPFLFFVPKNNEGKEIYDKGFSIDDLFNLNGVGFVSANDGLNISITKQEQNQKIQDILKMEELEWRIKYKRTKDSRDWTYKTAKKDATKNNQEINYTQVSYRPFDTRWSLYTGNSRGLYASPVRKVMQHFLNGENLGLVSIRRSRKLGNWNEVFVSEKMISGATTISALDINYFFPLYLYPNKEDGVFSEENRMPNLDKKIVKKFANKLGLIYNPNPKNPFDTGKDILLKATQNTPNSFVSKKNHSLLNPIDILDYIYAILHSPTYREKYKEFLKIDFPRVPYPKDKSTFWELVKLGSEIRQIHLLESPKVEDYVTSYPKDGDNKVTRKLTKTNIGYEPIDETKGKVWINDEQYFDNVPFVAWEFYIGGYQPAQKWLKDRKKRELKFEDILHYQKIIVALTETDRIMKEIDKIEIK